MVLNAELKSMNSILTQVLLLSRWERAKCSTVEKVSYVHPYGGGKQIGGVVVWLVGGWPIAGLVSLPILNHSLTFWEGVCPLRGGTLCLFVFPPLGCSVCVQRMYELRAGLGSNGIQVTALCI